MKKIKFLLRYLGYFLKARTRHGVHSPFVYKIFTEVICVKYPFYDFERIESVRSKMLLSKESIVVTDLGAGSSMHLSGKRKIRNIAARTLKKARYGQLLFRLVNHFRPYTILELGTSLGVSTLYLASAAKNAKVITLEGCPETAAQAKKNVGLLNASQIEIQVGNFDNLLRPALEKLGKADFVFIDGNHRKEPLLRYFYECKKYVHNDSLLVIDDIYWSDEMQEAWKIIKKDEQVRVTIDLFFLGLVFFRKEQEKEDFVLRF